ncbi:putative late blight resistance protein homolog R1A-10 isoform X2 [Salvia splendens]|uniref:putative late blight resistance protein homolog R1A-10 isoform X2 n=1 Tax=Salvia splendens TaxID=180675 RepID=UPI001C2671DF|nr:putative late blight resistance protein homolog R1A-10 isoform X2 [Salvia splendens]XP_042033551.1 putative late blight resistance protein homolog R1A-10 isoform X2 [Salvia splendens]XP_042033552.1 putative late blight resistance protein homolog R1A-10 isoform X2 [Salvia splendens]
MPPMVELKPLKEFLDCYISPFADSHDADPLERRIADAVYAAEDVIESHIVDQIQSGSTIVADHEFYHNLRKVIEEMDLINKDVKSIAVEAQTKQKPVAALSASSLTVKESVIVGSDEVFLEVLDKLAGNQLNLQIIPITGMGGIGKTTLAMNLFENALVKECFNIRAWTTISQTYNVRETLREVLFRASGDSNSDLSENELGQKLYQLLFGRKYLVIMDDMWSIEVWEKIKFLFPDNHNGSRIIVTTRLSDLSSKLNETCIIDMKFLDEASSWDLFCKTVFGKESCPIELEKIGKHVVANCKGLPLSIATIGGLLAKSEHTKECWEHIEQNLNSIVINTNDEFCLKILRMSYIYLPNYLKPCFLYMGVFEEDYRICVSMLKKLWVSEGFLKSRSGKCLETLAQEYFKELVDRNLVLVDELGSTGNVKYCKIHDLLRDMCIKEAEKERFYHVIRDDPPASISERRVVLKTAGLSGTLSHTRSIICEYDKTSSEDETASEDDKVLLTRDLRLLRTFRAYVSRGDAFNNNDYFLENVFELVNSRYLAIRVHRESRFSSSIDLLWNLQTLIIYSSSSNCLHVPNEIWKLHQLRHLEFPGLSSILPNPPSDDSDIVIMENLQTLKGVEALLLNGEVVKRIPNVKKLDLKYYLDKKEGENCLSYLQCFSKLESLRCITCYQSGDFWMRINFPNSIKKLVVQDFYSTEFGAKLEDILPKIGSLPLLEKLVLDSGVFRTSKWETIEGQFQNLKFLELSDCEGLVNWIVSDSSHFPLLQKLCLYYLYELEEIPSEVGEIATLKSISLYRCSEAVVASAKKIVEEREDLYGEQLHLLVDVA